MVGVKTTVAAPSILALVTVTTPRFPTAIEAIFKFGWAATL